MSQLGPLNTARFFVPRGKSMLTPKSDIGNALANGASPYMIQTGDTGIASPWGFLYNCPYNVYVIPLDTAFTDKEFVVSGTTLWFNFATDNTVLAWVKFNNPANAKMIVYPPLKIDGMPYSKFYIGNDTAQAGKVIQVVSIFDYNSIRPQLET